MRPFGLRSYRPRNALLLYSHCCITIFPLCLQIFTHATGPTWYLLLLNLVYTFGLKSIAILDIGIIAIGFVLRVIFGGVVTGLKCPNGPFADIFFGPGLGVGQATWRVDGVSWRKRASLTGYNLAFIDAALISSVTITIVCYIMYSIAPSVEAQFGFSISTLLPLFSYLRVFRYLQQTFVYQKPNPLPNWFTKIPLSK